MVKKMTIQEKKNRAKMEKYFYGELETVVEKIKDYYHWNYCAIKTDEDGNVARDENGQEIFIEPDKENWYYEQAMACKKIIGMIEELEF